MIVFPAIDLMAGRVVRLTQGDYDKVTVYGDDYERVLSEFSACGATHLHVVDLDGAKGGDNPNFAAVAAAAAAGLSTEVGGGIRDAQRIEQYLAAGVDMAILGTIAVTDFALAARLAKRYAGHIAAGVDARDGKVAIHGWTQVTDVDSFELCRRLADAGVSRVIYTDIARDGMGGGANLAAYEKLAGIDGLNVVASGGVTYEHEIASLRDAGAYGVIVGRALYTGALELTRVIAIAEGRA